TVKLIRSTPYEDVEDAMYACRVGTPIVPGPGEHDDPGRNGLVVNDRAPVDMVGPNAAYDRSTRVGPMVPVNAGSVDIAWYEPRDGLAWPARGRRYYCLWPRPGPRQSNGLGAGWERVIIAPDGDRRLRSTRWIPGLATPFTADLFLEANAPPLHPPVPSTGMALSIVKGVPAALAGASADFVGVASFEIQKDQEGAAVLTVTFVDQRSVSHPLPDDEVILELGYVFDGLLAHVQFRIDRV